MAGKREEQLKEITERLEQGVEELFTSERYTDYLKTMSQFHNYSFNNTLLIAMQRPDATLVAGYQAWKNKFNRQVLRGEKGIQIIAPVPIRQKEEVERLDPDTQEPILKENGQPETEEMVYVIPRFKVTTVFDVAQTDGEPLPSLGADELTGNVENYERFMEAVRAVSPVSMRFDEIGGESHGYYHNVDKEIVIQQGMSEMQTMKTAIHEVAHAKLHDRELMQGLGIEKDRMTKEVEAESIAYVVCQHFGLDTADYSFPYIAGWSSGKDMKELRASMDTIRHTAGEFIEEMTEKLQELQRNEAEKQHLLDNDLVLKISGSMGSEYSYDVIRGMEKEELLDAVREFQRLGENNAFLEEPDLEAYLSERGAEVIPWYASNGFQIEYPMHFYDIEYDADTGITDAASLSSMQQAENLIERAEYGGTLFNDGDRNLIVNYAYQFDNMKDTKALIQELAEAIQAPDLRAPNEVIYNAQAEIDALPDPMIGMTRMHEYGYENPGMLPLTKAKALELYHQNMEIFCLYEDGTEASYDNEAAIHTHDGIYGIEKESWEKYLEKERTEHRIMAGQEEMFSIYQIRDDSQGRDYQFMGTSFLKDQGLQARREDYNLVYTDVFKEGETLENIFQRFNLDRPSDFYGHSLSVSDVIVVSHNGETRNYYVDSFGFTELPEFFLEKTAEIEVPVQEKSLAERISDYDAMRDSIYLELIPREGNEDLLEQAVHRDMEDMAIVYKIALKETEDGLFSGTLKKSLFDSYGVTEEALYQNALITTEKRFPVRLMSMGMSPELLQMEDEPDILPSMLVASNVTMQHGATVMLYPDFMERVAAQMQGSFYILPSSQHEIILLAAQGENVVEELTNMVKEVNQTDAVGEDKLSDVVLRYDAQRKVLERAEDVDIIDVQEITKESEEKITGEAGKAYNPVYRGTLAIASERGEVDDYLDSRKLNIDCKNAIEEAIRENFDGYHLNHDVVTPVLQEYGAERMAFVLADTLQYLSEDGRFSRENKAWAEEIVIPENVSNGMDLNNDYVVGSHPAVLDGFIGLFREEAKEQLQELSETSELAYEVGDRYLLIHETEEGYDYTFYGKNYLELDGGIYSNPDVTIKEALIDILDEEDFRLEDCEELDYEEIQAWIELAEEEHFKQVQLEINCPNSIFEEYERLKDTTEYGGVAMKIGNFYLTVQPVEEGYDYIFYNDKLREINGDTFEDTSVSIQKATREIISSEQMADIPCLPMNYKEFESMTIERSREDLATEVTPTSQIGRKEAALNGQTRTDIEELVLDYAQSQLEEMKLEEDVTLLGARVYGSRTREGLFRDGSDIDVVLSYEGPLAEDSFFNVLHEHGMKVVGMELDINPISLEKTGSLEEYLNRAEKYLDEKEQAMLDTKTEIPYEKEALELAVQIDDLSEELDSYEYRDSVEDKEAQIQSLKDDLLAGGEKTAQMKEWFSGFMDDGEVTAKIEKVISDMDSFETKVNPASAEIEKEAPEREPSISFFVAECMEYPILGVYQDNLTMEEALEIYETIPAERMNGIKGVGFRLDDGSIYDGDYDLMAAGKVDVESINCIEHYKNCPLVQEAIVKMQAYLDAQQEKEAVQQETVMKESEAIEHKKEPVKYEQHEEPAGKTVEAVSKPEPVQTQIKKPEAKKEQTGGKKESVLQALRERQAKIKAQEQDKSKDKSQGHKKGDMEL